MLFRMRTSRTLWQKAAEFFWPKKGLRRGWHYIGHRLTRISASPHVIALGFAAGVFASLTPFIGFHFIIAGLIAFILGGNVVASAFGTALGNPLTFPLIWFSTYNVGAMLLGHATRDNVAIDLPEGFLWLLFSDPALFWHDFWRMLEPVLWPMSIGATALGLPLSLAFYLVLRRIVEGYQHRRRRRRHMRERQAENEA
jgi:uncharacterized protein (DUF2062 family)